MAARPGNRLGAKHVEPDQLRRAWLTIDACPHKDGDDGTCHHPENPTPECHEGACPYAR